MKKTLDVLPLLPGLPQATDKFLARRAGLDYHVLGDNLDINGNGPLRTDLADGTTAGKGAELVQYDAARTVDAALTAILTIVEALDNAVPGQGAALVGFIQSGAGAVSRTVAQELGEIVTDAQFGAVGDGVADDLAKLQAARDALMAKGGGKLILTKPVYGLSGSFKYGSGIVVSGKGAGQYPPGAFVIDPDFVGLPKTRFKALAGFPANTPMVDIAVTRGDKYAVQAAGLHGVMLDADNVANGCLRTRGIKACHISDVLCYRPTTTSTSYGWYNDTAQGAITGATAQGGAASTITLAAASSYRDNWYVGATISITAGTGLGQSKTITGYVGATRIATVDTNWTVTPDATSVYSITGEVLEGNGATQFNFFDGISVYLGTAGTSQGIVFDGDGVHDTNQNSYRNLRVVHADGPGLRMYNGDTDWFDGVSTYAFGNGWGLEMHGSETTSYEGWCRQQFFSKVLFGGANLGGRSNTAQAGAGLTITLDVGANANNDYYNTKFIEITGGTGVGQRRKIADYTGATKVALVSEAWTTAPDATSTFTINGGGGVALFKGAYRTSRFHTFCGYETEGNGAGAIYVEDGGAYNQQTERDYTLIDTDGFEMILGAGNAFATGTSSRITFMRRVLGVMKEMASLREFTTGTEASPTGGLIVYVNRAGTVSECARFDTGFSINEGSAKVKRLLTASANLNFASIPANSTADLTFACAGALVNDGVIPGWPAAPTAGITYNMWVSATDVITVRAANNTVAAIDPPNQTFRAIVVGH